MNDTDIEMNDLERLELEREQRLKDDIKWLLKQDAFKRAIIGSFINSTALNVGLNFVGSDEQEKALGAVSYLKAFLTNHSE